MVADLKGRAHRLLRDPVGVANNRLRMVSNFIKNRLVGLNGSSGGRWPVEIHLINLDRSVDRLANFKAVNAHLRHVTRITAIDGKTINWDMTVADGKFQREFAETYTDGAIGCALSHFYRWQFAIDHNRSITIAEDDAIIHHDFETIIPQIISTLPPNWDLIMWGWNFDIELIFDFLPGVSPCRAKFDEANMRYGWRNFQSLPVRPKPFRLFNTWGTVCYTVSPKGAEALIKGILPFNAPVDIAMNELYLNHLNAFVCFPPLVITLRDQLISTVKTNTRLLNSKTSL